MRSGASVTDRREVCYALYSLKSTFDGQRKLAGAIWWGAISPPSAYSAAVGGPRAKEWGGVVA
ncbi:trp operon repressor, partial [Klebsiella pneumoniae]